MYLVDLHIHSEKSSDGALSYEEIFKQAKGLGISVLSITDHGELNDYDSITCFLNDFQNMRYVAGIEITGWLDGYRYHILGYGIDRSYKGAVDDILLASKKSLADFANKVLKLLQNDGYQIDFDEYEKFKFKPGGKGSFKLQQYLIAKNICFDHKSYSDIYGKIKPSLNWEKKPDIKDIIIAIKNSGGVSVLAHPGSYEINDFTKAIRPMLDFGINGIECFHPNNNPKCTEDCIDIATKNNLLITGGSDFHGENVNSYRMGSPRIDISQLRIDGIPFLV